MTHPLVVRGKHYMVGKGIGSILDSEQLHKGLQLTCENILSIKTGSGRAISAPQGC